MNTPEWSVRTNQPKSISLITAGNKIISGSVNKKVTVIDTDKKTVLWTTEVDGIPYGLAVAHSKLYVSTDKGSIYCFDSQKVKSARIIAKNLVTTPYRSNNIYTEVAEEIIKKNGITDGYCMDIGCGDGRLAYELAKISNLHIYAIDTNQENVERARKKLSAAGLYGSRVTVHKCEDINKIPYPDYFANLIVSGRSVKEEIQNNGILDSSEISRIQHPYGGVVCFGKIGNMKVVKRGEIDGAGSWTHQYADPGNTISSKDALIRGDLGMLWFVDSDFETPSRHGRNVAPLSSDGRLFVQGNHGIRAYDSYNGHKLWDYYVEDLMKPYDQDHLTGVAVTHGNWCLEGDMLYVRVGSSVPNFSGRTCHVVDVVTGNKRAEYKVPSRLKQKDYAYGTGGEGYWGYIAVDNGILFGTIVNDSHVPKWGYRESDMHKLFSESETLFAMDALTGEVKWMYEAEHSIRHNTIAIGDGKVFIIDRQLADFDKVRNPHRTGEHPTGKLIALDANTGKVLYKKSKGIYGTLLALSTDNDILIMTYSDTRFKLPSEIGGRMSAFRASTGEHLWNVDLLLDEEHIAYNRQDKNFNYSFITRPIINGTAVYIGPYAYDLMSGERLEFAMKRSYGCGIISGSKNMMLFRSGTLGFIDLTNIDKGTQNYGGIRPGCWINVIPAGGVVLMPDYTWRCSCSYLIKANVGLIPLYK